MPEVVAYPSAVFVSRFSRSYAGFTAADGKQVGAGSTYWCAVLTDDQHEPINIKLNEAQFGALSMVRFGDLLSIVCGLKAKNNRLERYATEIGAADSPAELAS